MVSPHVIARQIAQNYLPEWALNYVKKIYYARALRKFSFEKEPDMEVLKYLVRSGEHVVDIGANIGVYTKLLSDLVKDDGVVYSIEPVPQTFEILRSNIEQLKLTNVNAANIAISDQESVIVMRVPLWKEGGENFYMAHIVDKVDPQSKLRHVNVKAKTLDLLFSEDASKITFIKCDVEGHELACIKGAEMVLQKAQPAWLVEISGNPDTPNSASNELFEILENRNYIPWYFNGKKLRRRRVNDKSTNYFFLTKKHIERLKKSKLELFD